MVDLERLKTRSLKAYELGRLRMALRILALFLPASVLCWFVGDRELCACLMPLLAAAVVWLRWRDQRGVDDVTVGLVAGSIPLAAGLLLTALRTSCGGPLCLGLSALAGAAAGLVVATHARRSSRSSWLAALAITTAAAVLGCSALGLFTVVGVLVGVAVGSGVGAVLAPR